MKLLRSIGVNLRRAVCSAGFLCCVLAVFVMCFANVIGTDPTTLDRLTIPAALMRPELIRQDVHYCAFQVFTAGSPVWVTMFTPVLAAFAYVPLLCDERRSQLGRLLIARQGKLRYALSHVCGAALTGGLTMLCGFALFGIAAAVLFPSLQSYDSASVSAFLEEQGWRYPQGIAAGIRAGHFAPAILLKCAEMFLYGVISALPALLCAAFTLNKYTVLCLPFFAAYSWTQLNARLTAKIAFSGGEYPKFGQFLSRSTPNALLTALERDTAQILLLHGGFALLLILIFTVLMQRRRDCGA
ncbi:MAG: hypothetical protein IJ060_08230 [Oscillospiraceae bacterium]|nr:hypothetical protein [Oscillospiraceae bacterium]